MAAEGTVQGTAEATQSSTPQPSLDPGHVVFNEEKKRNLILGVEHCLLFYEGKCPKTKGAMTNFEAFIRLVDLTHEVGTTMERSALHCDDLEGMR